VPDRENIIKGIKEEVLINRLLEGDQTAFELLFRFYYPGLVIFVKQLIADETEAEEIVQDFFVQLWINRGNIKKKASLKNYFFVSVRNRAYNFLKKEKLKKSILNELQQVVERDLLFQPDLFVESELQKQIKKALEKLPDRTREIFLLSRSEGIPNEEIAEQLGLSKRTVETQISNALRILRQELKAYVFLMCILGISCL
jgi:RNA polymerase sigma-70 factor (ECF subfamily)